jgi:hypothetical protein
MTYIVTRIYSGTGDQTPEDLANLAMQELAPRLASEQEFLRYITLKFADGRFGSFSAFQTEQGALRSQQIASDWVSTESALQSSKLHETLEGEVLFSADGAVPMTAPLHGVIRLYQTTASKEEVKQAFEAEGPTVIKNRFSGLARYTVALLSDGRLGTFGSFDTAENAQKSSQAAREVRGQSSSQIARVLPSNPQVLEATLLGVRSK